MTTTFGPTSSVAVGFRSTFARVDLVNGSQSVSSFSDARIVMNTVKSDVSGLWNTANNWYVCPNTGLYLAVAFLRLADGSPANQNYGISVTTAENTAELSDQSFMWNSVPGGAGARRTSSPYSKICFQNAGDALRLLFVPDGDAQVTGASLQIVQVA